MKNFEKVFSDYGYSLFIIHSAEDAIIDAIAIGEMRYILGIPLILERAEIDYAYLLEQAKTGKRVVLGHLMQILYISTKIIQNKDKKDQIEKIISGKKIIITYNIDEFEYIYKQYSEIKALQSVLPSPVHYQLSFLFAKKQIEIISKIKNGKRLTKTEKEYYSRTIKKKLIAVKELAGFAREIIVKD